MFQLSEEQEARVRQLVAEGRFPDHETALQLLELVVDDVLTFDQNQEEPAHHTPEFMASLDEARESIRRGEGKTYANATELMADLWPLANESER